MIKRLVEEDILAWKARQFARAAADLSARMVRRIHNVREIAYPLAAYEVRNAFKLYLNDIGMLRSVASVSTESLALDRDFPFKGRFVENYVLQQLAGQVEGAVHYYAERADREIDFVLQHDSVSVPVEVKTGEDRKAASFKTFVNARHPRYAIRFSERNLRQDGAFVNIPLYLASRFANCLPQSPLRPIPTLTHEPHYGIMSE